MSGKNKKKTCPKVKNACKFCLETVTTRNGLQCQGACQKWAHYKCLDYTPGKISDIKAGLIKVMCPCPDCETNQPKEFVTNPPYSCSSQNCPANGPIKCDSEDCPRNEGKKAEMVCSTKACLKDNVAPTEARRWVGAGPARPIAGAAPYRPAPTTPPAAPYRQAPTNPPPAPYRQAPTNPPAAPYHPAPTTPPAAPYRQAPTTPPAAPYRQAPTNPSAAPYRPAPTTPPVRRTPNTTREFDYKRGITKNTADSCDFPDCLGRQSNTSSSDGENCLKNQQIMAEALQEMCGTVGMLSTQMRDLMGKINKMA